MDYEALRTLCETHPSWPSVDDETLTDWVNEEVVSANKESLPNEEILAVILTHRAEFTALSDGDKQMVRDILYIGDSVPTKAGEPARDTLVAIFTAGSDTIQELAAAITYQISRAAAEGILGEVKVGDIQFARR